jgi:hypothetical protein
MAAAPGFAATPRAAVGAVSAANTARDGTGTIVTVFTAGSSGSLVETIVAKATGDPADSIVNIFLHDGTTAFLVHAFDLGDPAAASTTVDSFRGVIDCTAETPGGWRLPTGWSVRASITVAPTAGVVNVLVLGGDL